MRRQPAAALVLVLAGCAHSVHSGTSLPEEGDASFYGPGFYGKKTASGEVLRPGTLTAAHRTLPFGTCVHVTVVDSGRSVEVRINDRGPFAAGRILDVSETAARALGMVGRGVVRVRLTPCHAALGVPLPPGNACLGAAAGRMGRRPKHAPRPGHLHADALTRAGGPGRRAPGGGGAPAAAQAERDAARGAE